MMQLRPRYKTLPPRPRPDEYLLLVLTLTRVPFDPSPSSSSKSTHPIPPSSDSIPKLHTPSSLLTNLLALPHSSSYRLINTTTTNSKMRSLVLVGRDEFSDQNLLNMSER